MKKLLIILTFVGGTSLLAGCGFNNCAGWACGSGCGGCTVAYTSTCCGSTGWY